MDELSDLLARQDGLIARRQALHFFTQTALHFRLGRHWQVVLPGIYAAQTGPLTQRQRLRAALLFAGPDAQIDDLTALRIYHVRYLPDDDHVRVLVGDGNQRKSRDFVVVRRTIYMPTPTLSPGDIPVVPLSRALANFALRYDDERASRAVLSSAVQRKQVALSALDDELAHSASRGRPRLIRTLDDLHGGARSAPEGDLRALVASSKIPPRPLYNCLLQLPSGRLISPDLLIEEAGLIHESNGRDAHGERMDDFDAMQERHDALTAAGFTVLHNSGRQIAKDPARVLRQLEACFQRDQGRGMPPGVRILRRSAAA